MNIFTNGEQYYNQFAKKIETKQCEKEQKQNIKSNTFKKNQIWGIWFQENQTSNLERWFWQLFIYILPEAC